MSIKNNKGLDRKKQKEMDQYNKWCKEFNVGSFYVKPTEYYHTDYHYERIKNTEAYGIVHTLSDLFKRILHAM